MILPDRRFEGDLIITSKIIYYLTHTHPDGRRIENADLSAVLLDGNSGAQLLVALANNLTGYSQRHSNTGVDITSALETKLFAHLESESAKRKEVFVSQSHPLPMCFLKTAIRGLRVTNYGFSFFTNSDNHEFIVRYPDLLRRALKTGGYLALYVLLRVATFEWCKNSWSMSYD